MTDAPILRFTAQLKAEGWTDQRIARAVRDGELVRVVRNVYRWPGELTPQQAHLARARGVLSRMGSSVVLSHDSAALAHGLPVATADPAVVHMTTPPPARVRVRSGYHVHVAPLEADDVTEVNGVRVTSLARTACDLARTADFPWAVAAADRVLRLGVRRAELFAGADAAPGAVGTRALREVAAFADGRAGSIAESVSRVTMRRAGIPAPELQVEVIGPEGWVATSDFGWRDRGVVGEMDGEAKYRDRLERLKQSPEKVFGAERVRDDLIRRANWWPCHWGWKVAWDVGALGAKIREEFALAEAFRAGR